jgi:hypothetical protein
LFSAKLDFKGEFEPLLGLVLGVGSGFICLVNTGESLFFIVVPLGGAIGSGVEVPMEEAVEGRLCVGVELVCVVETVGEFVVC